MATVLRGGVAPIGVTRRRRPVVRRAVIIGMRVAVLLGAFALWQLLSSLGILDRHSVPGPVDTVLELAHQLALPALWDSLGHTVQAWLLGMAISIAIAVPVGILLGTSSFAFESSRFVVDSLRTVPSITLLPLAVLMFGASLQMQLLIIVFSGVWPLLLQVTYGCRDVDKVAADTFSAFRIGGWRRVVQLVVPSAAPYLATGLRLSAVYCLLSAVGAELLGGAPGLGQYLALSQSLGTPSEVFAVTALIAVLGYTLSSLLAAGERMALAWHPAFRKGTGR